MIPSLIIKVNSLVNITTFGEERENLYINEIINASLESCDSSRQGNCSNREMRRRKCLR